MRQTAKSKRCLACGWPNGLQANACTFCGVSMAVRCPQCQFDNQTNARFCGGCGQPLNRNFSSDPPSPIQPHIGEAGAGALPSARKLITVVFADIHQSTAMVEKLDPEQAAEQLDVAIAAMVESVHRFEGTINRIEGDGVMALFGAVRGQEDHAVHACHAALAILDAVQEATGQQVKVRVGVHTGNVVLRPVGNDLSVDLDIAGAAAHIAKRVQQRAAPQQALLSGETFALVHDDIQAEPLGSVDIDGLSKAMELFALRGASPNWPEWGGSGARQLTAFVGREDELARLDQQWAAARDGHAGIVALVGEAGIGKSRLLHEFLYRMEEPPGTRLRTGGWSFARNIPFFAVANLIRTLIGARDEDTQQAIEGKLSSTFGGLVDDPDADLAAVRAVLDLPAGDEWDQLDPPQRNRRLTATSSALLRAGLSRGSVVIVVEDMHWLDTPSEQILKRALTGLREARLLVVQTYRPEFHHDWDERLPFHRLDLGPLADDEANDLLTGMLGSDESTSELRARLVAHTGALPLFLEETVQALVSSGALIGSPGNYRLSTAAPNVSIPPTIESVVAARLDDMPAGERFLVQTMAVVGGKVSPALLGAVAGLDPDDTGVMLRELEAGGLVRPTGSPDAAEFMLKHAITAEVAYGGLLMRERRRLHAAVVQAFERFHGARLPEVVEQLAYHAFMGERWTDAAKYLRLSCLRAITRWAPGEAVREFERCLEALAHLPEHEDRIRAEIDIRLIIANVLVPLGHQERVHRVFSEAEALARQLENPKQLARVQTQYATVCWLEGTHARGIEACEDALRFARKSQDERLELSAMFNLGMLKHAVGALEENIAIQRQILRALPQTALRERMGWAGYPAVLVRTFLAGTLIEMGDLEEGGRHADDGCRIAREIGHAYSQAMINAIKGLHLIEQCRYDDAIAFLGDTMTICREAGVGAMYPAISAHLGVALVRAGRAGEAIELLDGALDPRIYRQGGCYTWLYLFLAAGEAYLAGNRREEALAHAQEAEALANRHGERAHRASALKLLADCHAAGGPRDQERSEVLYLEALAVARQHGLRPMQAHCHMALGELLAGRRPADAAAQFEAARELYSGMELVDRSNAARRRQDEVLAHTANAS